MNLTPLIACTLQIGHGRFGLKDKINTLGHYARKVSKAALKPLNLAIATAALSSLMSFSDIQAQAKQDTIYGTGIFQTFNLENNNSIPEVKLYVTPTMIAMQTPTITYEFTTNNSGGVPFELPVYIDSTTGIDDNFTATSSVFPTVGSELNAFFDEKENGNLSVYSISGQLVASKDFSADNTYLNLSHLSSGFYVYNISTSDGDNASGKFIKQDVAATGPSSRPSSINEFKDIQEYEAVYKVKWEKEGYITDSTEITLTEGNNSFVNFFINPEEGTPQDQDIAGFVRNGDNNYSNISGAQLRLINITTGDTLFTTSAGNGSFVFEDQPLDCDYLFSAGNKAGFCSFKDVPYTTPSEIEVEADTANNHFDVVLKAIPSSTTAQHIEHQTINGTRQDTVKFYLGDSFYNSDKSTIRGYFNTVMNDENSFIYVESSTQLYHTGINIEYGTYNTQAHSEGVSTPLGHTLYPILYANTTMGVGDYIVFVHEIKRAIGLDEVGWPDRYSVMETPVQHYTLEDRDIGEFEREYWNSVYQDSKTWISLDYISDGF